MDKCLNPLCDGISVAANWTCEGFGGLGFTFISKAFCEDFLRPVSHLDPLPLSTGAVIKKLPAEPPL